METTAPSVVSLTQNKLAARPTEPVREDRKERSRTPAGEAVEFETGDGFQLRGTYFPAADPVATVVVHPATSVPAGYYHRFAAYLASEGLSTLTYDLRGMGQSKPRTLRGFHADKIVWGEQDMSAAFEWLEDQHPDLPHFVVGHSVGGQFQGIAKRPQDIDGLLSVGSGFGSWMTGLLYTSDAADALPTVALGGSRTLKKPHS